MKVAAHAHGAEGIKRAVRGGIDSIEHGTFMDDEGIRLMKEHGTYLVADIYNDDYIMAEFTRKGYPAKIIEKERLVGRTQRENFRKAVQAGVKIAFGTDQGVAPHGDNASEFGYMVEAGMPAAYALQAATIHAAQVLGVDDTGTLTAGKRADIIAGEGDPLSDVRQLEDVDFVMKGGKVHKDEN